MAGSERRTLAREAPCYPLLDTGNQVAVPALNWGPVYAWAPSCQTAHGRVLGPEIHVGRVATPRFPEARTEPDTVLRSPPPAQAGVRGRDPPTNGGDHPAPRPTEDAATLASFRPEQLMGAQVDPSSSRRRVVLARREQASHDACIGQQR